MATSNKESRSSTHLSLPIPEVVLVVPDHTPPSVLQSTPPAPLARPRKVRLERARPAVHGADVVGVVGPGVPQLVHELWVVDD